MVGSKRRTAILFCLAAASWIVPLFGASTGSLYRSAMDHFDRGKRHLKTAMEGTTGGGARGEYCHKAEAEFRKALDLMEEYRKRTGRGDREMEMIQEQLYSALKLATLPNTHFSGDERPARISSSSRSSSSKKTTGKRGGGGWWLFLLLLLGGGGGAAVYAWSVAGKKRSGSSRSGRSKAGREDPERSGASSRRRAAASSSGRQGRTPSASSSRRRAAASGRRRRRRR